MFQDFQCSMLACIPTSTARMCHPQDCAISFVVKKLSIGHSTSWVSWRDLAKPKTTYACCRQKTLTWISEIRSSSRILELDGQKFLNCWATMHQSQIWSFGCWLVTKMGLPKHLCLCPLSLHPGGFEHLELCLLWEFGAWACRQGSDCQTARFQDSLCFVHQTNFIKATARVTLGHRENR